MISQKERAEALVAEIAENKDVLFQELAGVSPEEAIWGTEWSLSDALRHLITAGNGYNRLMRSIVEEGGATLPSFPSVEEVWKRYLEQFTGGVNETLAYVSGLDDDQLTKTAIRGGQEVTVLDLLEHTAHHFADHLAQIKNEIKPRVGSKSQGQS